MIKHLLSKSTVKWKVGRKISFEEALYNFFFYKNQTFFKANSVIRTKWKQNPFAQDYTAEISDFPQVVFFWGGGYSFFLSFFAKFLKGIGICLLCYYFMCCPYLCFRICRPNPYWEGGSWRIFNKATNSKSMFYFK